MVTKFDGNLEEKKIEYKNSRERIEEFNKQEISSIEDAKKYIETIFEMYYSYVKPGGEAPELFARRKDYANYFTNEVGLSNRNSCELDSEGNSDRYGIMVVCILNLKDLLNTNSMLATNPLSENEIIELAENTRKNYQEYDIENNQVLIKRELLEPTTKLIDSEKKAIAIGSRSAEEYIKRMFVEPRGIQLKKLAINGNMSAIEFFSTSFRPRLAMDTEKRTLKETLQGDIDEFERRAKPLIIDKLNTEYKVMMSNKRVQQTPSTQTQQRKQEAIKGIEYSNLSELDLIGENSENKSQARAFEILNQRGRDVYMKKTPALNTKKRDEYFRALYSIEAVEMVGFIDSIDHMSPKTLDQFKKAVEIIDNENLSSLLRIVSVLSENKNSKFMKEISQLDKKSANRFIEEMETLYKRNDLEGMRSFVRDFSEKRVSVFHIDDIDSHPTEVLDSKNTSKNNSEINLPESTEQKPSKEPLGRPEKEPSKTQNYTKRIPVEKPFVIQTLAGPSSGVSKEPPKIDTNTRPVAENIRRNSTIGDIIDSKGPESKGPEGEVPENEVRMSVQDRIRELRGKGPSQYVPSPSANKPVNSGSRGFP